jgi:hypothetical protein
MEGVGGMEGQKNIPFSEILKSAETGTDENWAFVDENLDPNDPEALSFAAGAGLVSENCDLRDLSYTIWAATKSDMPDDVRKLAYSELDRQPEDDEDSGRYARFRAAFALFEKGERTDKILETIKKASLDDDVKEIAEGYLKRYEEEQQNG